MSESDSLGRGKHYYAESDRNPGLRAEREVYTQYRGLLTRDNDIIDGGFATAIYNACKNGVPSDASTRAMDLAERDASRGEE